MFRLNFQLLQPGGRMFLSVLAIALGVALGFAVHLINRAAVNELAAGVRATFINAGHILGSASI